MLPFVQTFRNNISCIFLMVDTDPLLTCQSHFFFQLYTPRLHNVVDDFQSIVNNFFGPDESGMPGFNMSAVMLSAEKQRHEMEMRGPYSQAGSFAREPLIPNAILKRLSVSLT